MKRSCVVNPINVNDNHHLTKKTKTILDRNRKEILHLLFPSIIEDKKVILKPKVKVQTRGIFALDDEQVEYLFKWRSFLFKYQLGGRELNTVVSDPSTSNQNNNHPHRRSRRYTTKSYIDYLTTGQSSSRYKTAFLFCLYALFSFFVIEIITQTNVLLLRCTDVRLKTSIRTRVFALIHIRKEKTKKKNPFISFWLHVGEKEKKTWHNNQHKGLLATAYLSVTTIRLLLLMKAK